MEESTETIKVNIGKCHQPTPLLSHRRRSIIFPNTINLIQGQTGAHKTHLAEHFSIQLIRRAEASFDNRKEVGFGDPDPLDFVANREDFGKLTVVYIDTERDIKFQLPQAVGKILTNAGFTLEDQPETFRYTSIRNIPRKSRYEAVRLYLTNERNRIAEGDHLMVVIDVITDFGDDFNDLKQAHQLLDFLNDSIDNYNITFLVVIHENPNHLKKARGHLGTELANKATNLFQIAHHGNFGDDSVYRVEFTKTRLTKPLEPYYVKYNEQTGVLVAALPNEILSSTGSRAKKVPNSDLLKYLGEILINPMGRSKLVDLLETRFDCKVRSLDDRLKEIVEGKQIIPGPEGQEFWLVKKTSRYTMYSLVPVTS